MANGMSHNRFSARASLRYHFLEKKLNTGFGFTLLAIIALLVTWGMVAVDYRLGPVVVVVVGAICAVMGILKSPTFGLYVTIIFSSVTVTLGRMVNFPFPPGMAVEALTYLTVFSILMKYPLRKNVDTRYWMNPVMVTIYLQFAYWIIELFNPQMFSKTGWFSFYRKQVSYVAICYIVYALMDSRAKIIRFLHFMILLNSLCALYACKQQWFGYAAFEKASISPDQFMLLMQGGLLRKFSVFADPATSGIIFASTAILCIILAVRTTDFKKRFWYAVAVIPNVLGYSFSGTRTATLMLVAGIVFYSLVTLYEKTTLLFFLCSVFAFLMLMVMPYQNVVTNRIRSTFDKEDASANLRDYDRHQVQPYLHDHPMGGGIFTCGAEGPKYNPGHYLENFQPDGGYMKCLAETGSIGLAITLVFYFVFMRLGFGNFFRVRDPEIRNIYIALLTMMFTIMVAQIGQMAVSQYPLTLFFYAIIIIFVKLADYDPNLNP